MSYEKIKAIENIVSLGLNTHTIKIPSNEADFYKIIFAMEHCTIRTDHKIKSKDLPFYVIDLKENPNINMDLIWQISRIKKYKLIISDGIKYDPIQKYNLVTKIEKNGDFILEASELKIPLRYMYRYPLLSCYGNISDNVHDWVYLNKKIGINMIDIKHDLEELYTYQLYNRWLETTKYPIPVGIKKQHIVFWQI